MPKGKKNEEFIRKAMEFCGNHYAFFLEKDFHRLSTSTKRLDLGYRWAFSDANPKPEKEATLHFIAHSMGCAFAEGAVAGFSEQGYAIGKVIHINCFQARSLTITTSHRHFTIDYQMKDDPLINNPFLRVLGIANSGLIAGADYYVIEKSGIPNIFKRHRAPMGLMGGAFWEHLAEQTANQ